MLVFLFVGSVLVLLLDYSCQSYFQFCGDGLDLSSDIVVAGKVVELQLAGSGILHYFRRQWIAVAVEPFRWLSGRAQRKRDGMDRVSEIMERDKCMDVTAKCLCSPRTYFARPTCGWIG